MRYRRRNPGRDYGPASYGHEDPDTFWAMQDYGAALADYDGDERPGFALSDWRTDDAQPTHPVWACHDPGCQECGR